MFRKSAFTIAVAATTALIVAAAPRAEAAASVNVALFDMTAAGPGFGGQGYGPGTTGHGGMGMMGRGGFAEGRMGYGGGGMMGAGMMSIRTDTNTVKAGEVTFDVTNWSRSLVHEMLVVAVDNAEAPLPYDYNKDEVVESQVKMLGETNELEPNASKALTLDLKPGHYLLICNVPGHYASGMQTDFTVTP